MDTKQTKKNTSELYKALRNSLLSKKIKEETHRIAMAKNCLLYGKNKQHENVDTYALLKNEIIKHEYPLHELAHIKALVKRKNSSTWAISVYLTLVTYILDRAFNAEELLKNVFNKLIFTEGQINNREFFLYIGIMIYFILLLLVLLTAMIGHSRNNYLQTIIESVETDYKSTLAKGEDGKQNCNSKGIELQSKVSEPTLESGDATYDITITVHKT